MYGLVNKAVEQMVCAHHGAATWHQIREHAGVEDLPFLAMQQYPDALTYALVDSASVVLALSHAEILCAFGRYWTLYTGAKGYGALLKAGGSSLAGFLQQLDQLHTRVGLSFPQLRPPSFECTDITPGALLLHYYSERPGLAPMVIGLIEGLAELFATPVRIEVLHSRDAGDDHEVFRISFSEQTQ